MVRTITMPHVLVPLSKVLPVHTAMHGWILIVQGPADDGHGVAFMLAFVNNVAFVDRALSGSELL